MDKKEKKNELKKKIEKKSSNKKKDVDRQGDKGGEEGWLLPVILHSSRRAGMMIAFAFTFSLQ